MSLTFLIRIISGIVALGGAVSGPLGDLDPGLSFIFMLAGLVGAAALPGLRAFNGNHLFTGLSIVVAACAALAGPLTESYPVVAKWLSVVSVGLMALGRDLWRDFGVGGDDDDVTPIPPPGNSFGVLLLIFALVLPGAACGDRSRNADNTKEFAIAVFTIDAASVKTAQLLGDWAGAGAIEPRTALPVARAMQRVHAANGEVINFAKKHIVTDEQGRRVLRFDQAGKLELQRLAQALSESLRDALANELVFPRLTPDRRAELQLLILALTSTARTITNTIRLIKPASLKTGQVISLPLPREVAL